MHILLSKAVALQEHSRHHVCGTGQCPLSMCDLSATFDALEVKMNAPQFIMLSAHTEVESDWASHIELLNIIHLHASCMMPIHHATYGGNHELCRALWP